MAECDAESFGGEMAGCHSAADEMSQLESRISLKCAFGSSANSKNIRRTLQAIGWCNLEIRSGQRRGFGIPRGIHESLYRDFERTASEMEMHRVDLARDGMNSNKVGMEKYGEVGCSAHDVICDDSKTGWIVWQDIELSHSHGSGGRAYRDKVFGEFAGKSLVHIGEWLRIVVTKQVKTAERVNEGICSHATEGTSPLDEQGLRSRTRGGNGCSYGCRAATGDEDICFFKRTAVCGLKTHRVKSRRRYEGGDFCDGAKIVAIHLGHWNAASESIFDLDKKSHDRHRIQPGLKEVVA